MQYKIHSIITSNYKSEEVTLELYDFDNWIYKVKDIFPIIISKYNFL